MRKLICSILNGKTWEELIPEKNIRTTVNEEFKQRIMTKTKHLTPVRKPYLINLSGIPGSGKSTLAQKILQAEPNLLFISFDEIMESISFYQEDFSRYGAKFAFSRWELPARHLGYKLLLHSIKNRYAVLFEHSNALREHLKLYSLIRADGYFVEIRFIDIDVDTAISRTRQYARFVPEVMIRERHQRLTELLPEYEKVASKFIAHKSPNSFSHSFEVNFTSE